MSITNIKYRSFKTTDKKEVAALIKKLYGETSKEGEISNKNINKTFCELLKHPERGKILILEKKSRIIGYCLLAHFWSNEYGGIVLIIDEIYIKPEFRGKNIGSDFIKSLIRNKFMKAVTFQLEVKPSNIKVIKVYKEIGFKSSTNSHLIYKLSSTGAEQLPEACPIRK